MEVLITSKEGSVLEFQQGVPTSLQNYVLPGVPSMHALAPFGKVILHEMKGGGFTILYSLFICDKEVELQAISKAPMLDFELATKNDVHYSRKGLQEIYMLEKQFNFFYTPCLDSAWKLEEKQEYSSLSIQFEEAYLQRMAPHFPFWKLFLNRLIQVRRPS